MTTKVAVLTSNHARHCYFVNTVAQSFEVVGVVAEQKSFNPMQNAATNKDEAEINHHFSLRDQAEKAQFPDQFQSELDVLFVDPKGVNSDEVLIYLQHKSLLDQLGYAAAFNTDRGLTCINKTNRYELSRYDIADFVH